MYVNSYAEYKLQNAGDFQIWVCDPSRVHGTALKVVLLFLFSRSIMSKVRINVLLCLQAVIKVSHINHPSLAWQ